MKEDEDNTLEYRIVQVRLDEMNKSNRNIRIENRDNKNIVKNMFLFYKQKKMYGFVYQNQFETSERMMKNYMRRDYEFYLNADTAVIQRSITSDVNNMYALILSLLQLISDLVMAAFLIVTLLTKDYKMTIIIAVLLLITLGIIKNVFKPIAAIFFIQSFQLQQNFRKQFYP